MLTLMLYLYFIPTSEMLYKDTKIKRYKKDYFDLQTVMNL